MYGSTIFIITLTQDRVRDGRLWYAPWLFPGPTCFDGGAGYLWNAHPLVSRSVRARLVALDTAFATLAAEADKVPPGSDGLLFLPYFSGERTPIHDPQAKGAFFGMNLTHTSVEHMYRALIEGIAFGTAHVVETYREAQC